MRTRRCIDRFEHNFVANYGKEAGKYATGHELDHARGVEVAQHEKCDGKNQGTHHDHKYDRRCSFLAVTERCGRVTSGRSTTQKSMMSRVIVTSAVTGTLHFPSILVTIVSAMMAKNKAGFTSGPAILQGKELIIVLRPPTINTVIVCIDTPTGTKSAVSPQASKINEAKTQQNTNINIPFTNPLNA